MTTEKITLAEKEKAHVRKLQADEAEKAKAQRFRQMSGERWIENTVNGTIDVWLDNVLVAQVDKDGVRRDVEQP